MNPGPLNITIYQGTDQTIQILFEDPDGPVDLTDWTAISQWRKTAASSTVVLEQSTDDSNIVLGGVAGTIDLIYIPTDTEDMDPGEYEWDLRLTTSLGELKVLLKGTAALEARISRDD
jgi:hypothetical protein